jgi:hypothetical protein
LIIFNTSFADIDITFSQNVKIKKLNYETRFFKMQKACQPYPHNRTLLCHKPTMPHT